MKILSPKLLLSHVLIISLLTLTSCQYRQSETLQEKNKVELKKNFTCTAYINEFHKDINSVFLSIDSIEYFIGEDAIKAFTEDQKKNIIIDKPTGYYIRNFVVDSINLKISENCLLTMQTLSNDENGNYRFNQLVDLQKWQELVLSKRFDIFKLKPFKLKIANSEIIAITEIYIP